ncbi:VRR-NUC domain-containing protein [Paraburkholderia sp. BL9I2N2]|uniref:VRR-NUC domain-containing protein n=1 Tax=Paraburkholderia sp. BL9I2N2 TaxID=1938809 RepID=UPI0010466F35|nr:VRR-NUC domain-containing protein [Paraburkholderia sp. BL9I2N2]TCK87341.1 VRR-NUC domain-containing protein [Paraburkholderia sp. BL9I2N2]
MKYARRADGNQVDIVAALRANDCLVTPTHTIGGGFPDLVVMYRPTKRICLIEVKDPSKPASDRKLTPAQQEFHASWSGPIYVVETPEQAIAAATANT